MPGEAKNAMIHDGSHRGTGFNAPRILAGSRESEGESLQGEPPEPFISRLASQKK